jgi:DNA-binding transcriptional LysR family regulator
VDRLEAMSILIASIEAGSFSAAGRKLGIPLPSISRKVSDLEAHLKTQLVARSSRKLQLTDAGATYVAAAKAILERVSEAEAQAAGEYTSPRGELTMTAPIVFGRIHVVPVVNEFLRRYLDINIRMTLADRNINLVDDNVDLAVRVGTLPDSSMIATRLGTIRRVVCGSPAYFAAHGIPKSPADLADLTCVTFSGMGTGTSWAFVGKDKRTRQGPRPRCRLNINTAEAAIDSAIAGVGITHVLSYQVADAVRAGKLRIVLQNFEPAPVPVSLIYTAQSMVPTKLRSFLEFATPRLRKSLGADDVKLASEAAKRSKAE